MTREEFERECSRIKPEAACTPTDEEYRLIEAVYTWHPSISETEGKKQIAYLYMNFGMSIIRDMQYRADLARKNEEKLSELRGEINKLQEEIRWIREGGEI